MAGSFLTLLNSRTGSSRGLRLASGIVLLAYVATHLLNHAAGLVSLAAAESSREWFVAAWRSLPLTVVFYGALLVHIVLALTALQARRTLRMPPLEWGRIVLGLSIPFLLASHFAFTRLAHERFGLQDDYTRVVTTLWANDAGGRQMALMGIAWLHGCIGIHLVVRHRKGWRERFHLAFAAALLLPVLAGLGFLAMARELASSPAQRAPVGAAQAAQLAAAVDWITVSFGAALAFVLSSRLWRSWQEQRRGLLVTLTYPSRTVDVPRGWSVLEASREHGIPHLSLCGGRARCSTCRVRVAGDPASCPPPSAQERRTLRRIGAPAGVRLACQLRPLGPVAVTPLLSASASWRAPRQDGLEREVGVLFVDLRRWTTLSERHLPHDLAYVLDRFFDVVGQAVREAGGVPNQFIGDSVMALFGLDTDLATACRQALKAARAIEAGIDAENERFRAELGQPLGFGIGLHAGRAVVGEVGWQETRTFTAVGDAVNTAARLQELCKGFDARLVVSQDVLDAAGVEAGSAPLHMLPLRGRRKSLALRALASARDLPVG